MARTSELERLRKAERELAAELGKLRARISAAEKGENKRIKDANRYIARTLKRIDRSTREQEKLQERELEKLERFLGETFESVGEAREALQKQTRKATKREKQAEALRLRSKAQRTGSENQRKRLEREAFRLEGKLNPTQRTYTIRQLSEYENETITEFLRDNKSWAEVGEGFLKDNERITVSVPYRYYDTDSRMHTGRALGRKVFRSLKELQAYMMYGNSGDPYVGQLDEWLGDIEIIKFPDEYAYHKERGRQTDVINARRKAVKKLNTERKRKAYKKGKEVGARQEARKQAKKTKLKGRK